MTAKSAFCTIIAGNYLAGARTLSSSLQEIHPDIDRYVLFIDDYRKVVSPRGEPFQALSLEDIGLTDLDRLRFSYDVVELATVVKPQLLRHLLTKLQLASLIYLDPDTLVLHPLDELHLALKDKCNLILTPHLDADYPDDGHAPNTSDILVHGLYNLGFIAIRHSAETMRFLDWWDQKIRDRCTRDYSTVYYVDQRVMDLVPLLFEGVRVEDDPGYNVAYWNMHTRQVRFRAERWFSNDRPLRFFHFSGFDPERPDVLSRSCNRPIPSGNEDIRRLMKEYGTRVLRNGYLDVVRLDYGHGRFPNGEEILYSTRRYFRKSGAAADPSIAPFASARNLRRNRLERFKNEHPKAWKLIYRLIRRLPIAGEIILDKGTAKWV